MDPTELKETFSSLLRNYAVDEAGIKNFWNEIETNYSDNSRYYHTLDHLTNLLTQLMEVKDLIHDWQTLLFTLYYHDIIYNPVRSDNEEKSARLAEERMQQIGVPYDQIRICKDQILATKSHIHSEDADTNYFTDADLSILGQPWQEYSRYYKSIRKEFSIYPDAVYDGGRKKVLLHFLGMNRIFKTDYFFKKFETKAKHNLAKEVQLLSDRGG
jgi:predicted metal-dependent HD superfamily phosphohydrolase